MTVGEIARCLGVQFEGEGGTELTGAGAVESAGPDQLSFVGGAKFFEQGASSRAGCLIAGAAYPASPGQTVIRAESPRRVFAQALALLYPAPEAKPGIHPTAVVAETAEIGDGVEIGPFVSIGGGSRIGARTRVGSHCRVGESVEIGAGGLLHSGVTIYAGTRIGNNVVLHSGCVLGADGFGFALDGSGASRRYVKFPQVGHVEIGDSVEVGANACIDRAALGVTSIGEGTKIDNMVHIGHNCRIGRHVVVAAQTGLSGGVEVGDYAVIGGQVGIGDKARIEAGAVLGSGCGVLTSKIVRAGTVVWGTPARPLKQYLETLANLARIGNLRERVKALESGQTGR